MKTLWVLSFFYMLGDAQEAKDDFTALAAVTREYYGSSGIFILYDNHRYGFKEERILLEAIRSYSKERTMSQAIAYDNLDLANKRHEKVLFALDVNTKKSLDRVIEATKKIEISSHAWLLFANITGFDCEKPGKDFFNLKMNTKMMAKCQGDNVLRKYYGIFNNRTEVFNLGNWNSERNELRFASKKSRVESRTNFKGITLNVAETTRKFNGTHTKVANYQNTLMEELAFVANFRINMVETTMQNDVFGYYNSTTRRWIGVIEEIIGKKVDTSMLLSSVSGNRLGAVDYVTPILTSQCYLFAKLPESTQVPWAAYFEAFNENSLMAIGFVIIFFSVLLSWMKMKYQKFTTRIFLDNFMNVWGFFNLQATSDNTSISSIRVVYFVVLATALILNTIYSATIASFIAALDIQLPFSSYEEFVRDDSYKLALLKYSDDRALIEVNDTLITPLKFRLKDEEDLPAYPSEALQQLCQEEKTALYAEGLGFEDLNPTPWSKCTISRVKVDRVKFLSFVLPKNSPYTRSMNYLVLRLRELGILSRLKNQHFRTLKEIPEVQPNIITLEEIVPILAVLVIGMIASMFVLLMEVIVYRISRRYKEFESQREWVFQRNIRFTP